MGQMPATAAVGRPYQDGGQAQNQPKPPSQIQRVTIRQQFLDRRKTNWEAPHGKLPSQTFHAFGCLIIIGYFNHYKFGLYHNRDMAKNFSHLPLAAGELRCIGTALAQTYRRCRAIPLGKVPHSRGTADL